MGNPNFVRGGIAGPSIFFPIFHAQKDEEEEEGSSTGSRAADPAPAGQSEQSSSSGIRRSPCEEIDEDIAAALDAQFGVATAEPIPISEGRLVVTAAPTSVGSRGTIRIEELGSLHDLPQFEQFVHPLERIFPRANRGDVVIFSEQHIDPGLNFAATAFAINCHGTIAHTNRELQRRRLGPPLENAEGCVIPVCNLERLADTYCAGCHSMPKRRAVVVRLTFATTSIFQRHWTIAIK